MLQSRELGFWETFKAITHDVCQGFETMSVTTQFVGKIDILLFNKALEFVYHRHPLLQATIQEKNNIYYYDFNTSFEDIPIQFKKGVNEEIFQKSLYDGANCSLQPQKHLWKVDVFYENNVAIFTMVIHHSPCDGGSMMKMVDEILYSYSCYLDNETPKCANLPLLPPTEHLSMNSTLENYLKKREEILTFTAQKNSILSLGPQQNFVPLEQRVTQAIYQELSEEQTVKILNFCNKKNVTCNSFLNGLMLIVAQRLHGNSLSLAMLTPVHTKPSIDKEHLGCHVSLVTTLYENINSNSNVLEMSNEYQRKLKHEIPRQAHLPKEFSKTDVCNAFGLNLDLNFYKYQLVVSNLGKIPVQEEYKNCMVEKIQVGVNNRVGAVACVLITHIWRNRIQLVFVYTNPLISEDYIENFSKEFMQIIHDLI